MELDPLFVRGLRLLHSRSRDSTDQLRALLDEVRQRTGRAAGGGKLSPVNRSPRSTPAPTGRPDQLSIKRGLDKVCVPTLVVGNALTPVNEQFMHTFILKHSNGDCRRELPHVCESVR